MPLIAPKSKSLPPFISVAASRLAPLKWRSRCFLFPSHDPARHRSLELGHPSPSLTPTGHLILSSRSLHVFCVGLLLQSCLYSGCASAMMRKSLFDPTSPNSFLLFLNCFMQAPLAAVRLVVWADLHRLLRRHLEGRCLNAHPR
jgi:hypothetical protein